MALERSPFGRTSDDAGPTGLDGCTQHISLVPRLDVAVHFATKAFCFLFVVQLIRLVMIDDDE